MGNWAKALQNAGEAAKGMAGLKMQEADWMYKEIAQQNQFRHAEQMQKGQQEFLSKQAEDAWNRDQPYRTAQLNLQAQGVDIQKTGQELQLERMTQQWEQFMASYGQAERRLELEGTKVGAAGQAQAARTAQEQEKIDQEALENFDLGNPITDLPEAQTQKKLQYEAVKDMLTIKPVNGDIDTMNTQRETYRSVYGMMAGETPTEAQASQARKGAKFFSKLSAADQQIILNERNALIEKGTPAPVAFGQAINNWKQKSKAGAAATDTGAEADSNVDAEAAPKAPEMAENTTPSAPKKYPPPPAPAADNRTELEKEIAAVAEERGVKIDPTWKWLGGGKPLAKEDVRNEIIKEAERRLAEKQKAENTSEFLAAAQ